MPVHRVTLTGGKLQETYVTLDGDELVESSGEPSTPGIASRLDGLRLNLAEGQTAELNLELDQWIGQAAAALDAGFLLSIDYGDMAEELYSPERRFRGTLTTFYQHVQTDAPLQRVGRQDITAQVDFTTLVNAGRKAGFKTLGYTTQGEFLSNLGLEYLRQGLASLRLPGSSLQSNQVGMLQLARPDGLGKFRVLAQGKNVEGPPLWGFAPSTEAQEFLSAMPVPLLTDKHLSLMQATYPNAGMGFEHLWPWGDPDEPSS
jgi:SAM-dependent MidA family methyltransferase